jgi:hypothetical protein
MKSIIGFIIAITLVQFVGMKLQSQPLGIEPGNGERVVSGEVVTVIWDPSEYGPTIDIKLWDYQAANWIAVEASVATSSTTYSWTVSETIAPGRYRMCIDDGTPTFSHGWFRVVSAPALNKKDNARSNPTSFTVVAYPNPANRAIELQCHADQSESIACRLVSANGKVVLRTDIGVNEGYGVYKINLDGVSSGSYNLILQGASNLLYKVIKVIK